MTALTADARERLVAESNTVSPGGYVTTADLRALLSDLAAAERERDEARKSADGMAEMYAVAFHERDALRADVAKLREALECAEYELGQWVQTYGERGPTRFVAGAIAAALRATAPAGGEEERT